MVKLQEKDNQFTITIPKDLVRSKGWKKGQEVALGFDAQGNIVIKEIKEK